ncbi:FCD domain-containing protein [Albimonas sp. CAU 1670]|uniref:FadR/GntR family transcriptional regulator n=1 Tax=Albimonas sp. CAU 1670 TaxID=3032599 RepID=UPI0023DC2092|nr:FCD domain-containing protein [Albimonas sp. CAU 1670]MDF2234288.1 FCD domain-containing protein [Albimonas sp. CAU 1670]
MTITHAGGEPTHSGRALVALRALLAAGVERPDGRLPSEAALARQLGVGRRALRRALEVLEAEGQVWRNRADALFVNLPAHREPALDLVRGLLEARLRLEPELAALAALRARPEDLRRMRLCAQREIAAGDVDAAELWGGAVHRQIALAAANPGLLAAFDALDAARAASTWRDAVEAADWRDFAGPHSASDHDAVIDAIASGDGEAAAAAMRAHLLTVAERTEIAEAPAPR